MATWNGRLYVGTPTGLFVYDSGSGPAQDLLPGRRIYCVCAWRQSVFAGTDGGLFDITGQQPIALTSGRVVALTPAGDRLVICFDEIPPAVRLPPSTLAIRASAAAANARGDLIYATHPNRGVVVYSTGVDGKAVERETIGHPVGPRAGFGPVLVDRGRLYFGAGFPGELTVLELDDRTQAILSVRTGRIHQLLTHDANIWAATNSGLYRIRRDAPTEAIAPFDGSAVAVTAIAIWRGDLCVAAGARIYHFDVTSGLDLGRDFKISPWSVAVHHGGGPFAIDLRRRGDRGVPPELIRIRLALSGVDLRPGEDYSFTSTSDESASVVVPRLDRTINRVRLHLVYPDGQSATMSFIVVAIPAVVAYGAGVAVLLGGFLVLRRPLFILLHVADWEFYRVGGDLRVDAWHTFDGYRYKFGLDGHTYTDLTAAQARSVFDEHPVNTACVTVTTSPDGSAELAALLTDIRLLDAPWRPSDRRVPRLVAIQFTSPPKAAMPRTAGRRRMRFCGIGHPRDLTGQVRWPGWWARVAHAFRPPRDVLDLLFYRVSLARAGRLAEPRTARTHATRADFVRSLREADVVHVLAHGSDRAVEFGTPYDVHMLEEDLRGASVRARVVVFSSCSLASEFVLPLVRSGIMVVAFAEPIDYYFLKDFFAAFYAALFPRLVRQTSTAGEACRQAAAALQPVGYTEDATFSRNWGSLVLYGDPTLSFRLRWRMRFWRRTDDGF